MHEVNDLHKDPYKNQIVVGIIIYVFDEDGKVLLFKRKNAPFAGYWEAPGGKLEFMEPLKKAAVRELKEETGIDVSESDLLFVDLLEHIIEPAYHRILVVYAVKVPRGTRIVPTEHEEYGWFAMDELPAKLLGGPIHKAYKIVFGDECAEKA